MGESRSSGPLEGIRVLDMSTMMAGPYGATLLGDLGADVVKIESHYGDESRHLEPERDGEKSAFLSLNRNKRAIVADLRRPAAQEVFARLLATTDILITNIRGPALARLGIEYEQVREHRQDIIWIGVTAFGADGPYAGRAGIDFLAQGYAGLLALNGVPGGPTVRVTVPMVDTMTSLLVVSGALSALHVREKSGEGQRIDICLLDALTHAQCSGLGSYLNTGEIPPKTGNRSQYFSPSGVYTCGDGKEIVITCPSEKFFGNLCEALDVRWVDDPRFESINMGQGGYGIGQAYLWYARDGLGLEHHVHVFAFITADFARMLSERFQGYGKPVFRVREDELVTENLPVPRASYAVPWLVSRREALEELRSLQLLRSLLKRLRPPPAPDASHEDLPQVASRVFTALQRLNEQKRSELVLAYLPMRGEYRGALDARLPRFVRKAARARGIAYVDLIEELGKLPAQEVRNLYIGKEELGFPGARDHLTARGNEWVAARLHERIAQLPSLRRRLE